MVGIDGIMDKTRIDLSSSSGKKLKDSLGKDNFRRKLESALEKGSPDKKKQEEKKLMDTCIEMESIFVNSMLKEMRKTVHKSELMHGGFAEEIFEDMLYDQYSLNISKNTNLGIAKMLYNEMKRKI